MNMRMAVKYIYVNTIFSSYESNSCKTVQNCYAFVSTCTHQLDQRGLSIGYEVIALTHKNTKGNKATKLFCDTYPRGVRVPS